MLILISVIAALGAGAGEVLLYGNRKDPACWVKTWVRSSLFVTLGAMLLFRGVFGRPYILNTQGYELWDFVLYGLLSGAAAVCLLLCRGLVRGWFSFAPAPGKKRTGLKILAVAGVFLGCLMVYATDWSKAQFGDRPADQMLITFLSPTVGGEAVDYAAFLEGPVFYSLALAALFGLFACSERQLMWHRQGRTGVLLSRMARRIISLVLAGVVFLGGIGYGVIRFQLVGIYHAYLARSSFLEEHYVDPREANLQFPEKKRNLIHIYLESMENSYMDRENGGFMEENLIPELTQIAGEGCSFSHTGDTFGGPQAAVGTTWSVASMVNMSTGLPMKAPAENNAYGTPGNFLPGACTTGDILREQGYEQTVMFGADADFGGLTYFFQTHGDFKIMDYKYALKTGMLPEGYRMWWGYEDDKLLEFAKEEITRLSQTGKPFHFLMETADTHRPEGFLSKYAERTYPNRYANVLAYNSQEVGKFIRWIQEQPFYENTTVVITGDHLSMESIFFQFYEFTDDYRRSQYNVILNPAPGTVTDRETVFFNRDYGNFDFFPTILTSLGVTYTGSRLGIGTDLFSGDQTLFEEYGFSYANTELEKKSVFYNKHILDS